MKKRLLFIYLMLLAATGTSLANSLLYIDDFEVSDEQMGTLIKVPVKAHFDARVQSFIVDVELSDGLTLEDVVSGADLPVQFINKRGRTQMTTPMLGHNANRIMCYNSEEGCWDPDGDGVYESYGVVKWESGDYDEMVILCVNVSGDFQEGTITLSTTVSSQADDRGGTVADNGDAGQTFTHTAVVSLLPPPIETPAPEIYFDEWDDFLIVHVATVDDSQLFVQIFVNGSEVENCISWGDLAYEIERVYDDIQVIEVVAYAQYPDGLPSETVNAYYEFSPKERPVTDPPSIEFVDEWEYIKICVTGDGQLSGNIMYDGYEMATIEGENTFVFNLPREANDYYNTHEIIVTAYAQAPECLQSEATVQCYILEPIVPPDSPAPTIVYEVTENAVVITIQAEGMLWVFIDGQEYYDDYNYYDMRVITIPRGEEDMVIHVDAYAQIDGWLPSAVSSCDVLIPALERIYDFEEDGIFYKITSEGKVSVTYETTGYSSYSGNVVIPATVTHDGETYMVTGIRDRAFMYCTELTGVTIGGNVTTIGADAFLGCTALTNVVLGNYVITIGTNAFNGCTSLASLTLGSGLRNIGTQAFKGCTALTSVICKAAVPPVMANSNCFDCYSTATLTVHPAVADSYRAATNWNDFAAIDEREAVDPAPGDANGDGILNIQDVTDLIDLLLGGN